MSSVIFFKARSETSNNNARSVSALRSLKLFSIQGKNGGGNANERIFKKMESANNQLMLN